MTNLDKELAYWITNGCPECTKGGPKRLIQVAKVISNQILPERQKGADNNGRILQLVAQVRKERGAAASMAEILASFVANASFVGEGSEILMARCTRSVKEWQESMKGMK